MNIALIGYGKMGKAIEAIAIKRGHQICARVDAENPIEKVDLSAADVAIEFTAPHAVLQHIDYLLEKNIPTVVGTTGWNEALPSVKDKVKQANGALLHASNFSVGVNLFFELNKYLAKLMSPQSDYKVQMTEIHHLQKLDAPSGTAISLADGITANHKNYNAWFCEEHDTQNKPANDALEITALREENVPGTHKVAYQSAIDRIVIEHEAHSREGFASGAVVAAEWLIDKKGVFTMQDVLNLNSL